MFKKMMHVAFWAKDMERMLAFYIDVMGFEKIFDMDNVDGTPGTVYLRTPDGRYIELFHGGTDRVPAGDAHTAGYSHLCFEVDDAAAALSHAKGKGVRLIDETPRSGVHGLRIGFLHPKSTFGVLTEFAQEGDEGQ